MKGDGGITHSEDINGKDSSYQVSDGWPSFGGGFSCRALSSFQPHSQCNPQPCQLSQCLQVKHLLSISTNGLCRYSMNKPEIPGYFLLQSFPTCSSLFSTWKIPPRPLSHDLNITEGLESTSISWVPPLYWHSDPHSLSGSPLAMLSQMSSFPRTFPVLKLSHVLNPAPILKPTKTIGPRIHMGPAQCHYQLM